MAGIFSGEGQRWAYECYVDFGCAARRFMPLAVGLSFGFYLPVVLFSGAAPIVGVLMIPKTIAYVWIILMGWKLYKNWRYSDG